MPVERRGAVGMIQHIRHEPGRIRQRSLTDAATVHARISLADEWPHGWDSAFFLLRGRGAAGLGAVRAWLLAFQLFDPPRQFLNAAIAFRQHSVHLFGPGYQPCDLTTPAVHDAPHTVKARF